MCFMVHMYQYNLCFRGICVLCVFVPHVPHVIYVTGVVNYCFILCVVAQDLKEHQQFFPNIHENNTFLPNPTTLFIPIMRLQNCAACLLTN